MSITRSHSQPAPATDRRFGAAAPVGDAVRRSALILVAHGDRGGEGGNRAVFEHAARVGRAAPLWDVRVGVLNGSPSLEDALADASDFDRLHVLPMLMSEGYFTETVIPSRLDASAGEEGGDRVTLHPAIGLSGAVSDLATRLARHGAARLARAPRHCAVLMVGHGARTNARARQAIEQHARVLRGKRIFRRVDTAYLEEETFLADAVAGLRQPTIVVGMFISDGLHAGEDVPELLHRAPCDAVHYTGAIGAHPAMRDIIADQVIGTAFGAGG